MFISYDPGREGADMPLVVTGFPCEDGFKIVDIKQSEKAVQAMSYLQRPRLRFNWGYWDGAALTARGVARQDGIDAENIVGSHFDPFYAHGFVYGAAVVKGQGINGQSSESAWQDFLAGLTDPDLLFRVEANP